MNTTPTVKKLTVADLRSVKGAQDAGTDGNGYVIEIGRRYRIYIE